jgi:hypothetical protein
MRFLIFITSLCLIGNSYAEEEPKRLLGVFSNEAEGFKIVTVIIHEDGLAYLHASVSGQTGEWSFDEPSSRLSLKIFDPSTVEYQTVDLRFDKKSRTFGIIRPDDGDKKDQSDELHFISDEIPKEMIEAFKAYPEQIKKVKAQSVAERDWKTRREQQLERERPEYERILAEIKANPRSVLSKQFYGRMVTPATRAFQASLNSKDCNFPEEVLVGLLEQLPDDNHWIRALIFSRRELTADTLKKFYPKALEWGELNYDVLANIAKHPNTPIEIVRDLAGRDELAGGATDPAKQRLEKTEREKTNK